MQAEILGVGFGPPKYFVVVSIKPEIRQMRNWFPRDIANY